MQHATRRRSAARVAAILSCLAFVLIPAATGALPADPACPPHIAVPDTQARIYNRQAEWLAQYRKAVAAQPTSPQSAPAFGAHLLTADSNRAAALLQPDAMQWVTLSLDRFQQMGVTGITLNIGYPMLLPEFPDSARYLAYYREVAKEIRKRHMTLAVEQIVLYSGSQFSAFNTKLANTTLEQYTADQTRMAQILIDNLAPDYLTVMHEPDTIAGLTGLKSFLEPATATRFVTAVLAGIRRGSTKIGAGQGSWIDPAFSESLAKIAGLDYIDAHIYWINPPSTANLYAIVKSAKAHNKPVIVTEAGLYKSIGDDNESGTYNVDGVAAVYRRDVFSFWEPLDIDFLDITTRFARSADVKFLSVYWSNMFFAYVDWTPETDQLNYAQLNTQLAGQKTALAWQANRFTCVARAYEKMIAN